MQSVDDIVRLHAELQSFIGLIWNGYISQKQYDIHMYIEAYILIFSMKNCDLIFIVGVFFPLHVTTSRLCID